MYLVFLGLLSTFARAGSFMDRPFENTVETAAVVVRGVVGPVDHVDWGESATGGRAIYTFTEFQVDEWIKGQPEGNRILVRQLGGEKEGAAMQVPGVAPLRAGESVVLLLRNPQTDRTYDIQGMMQGRYEIQKGPDGEDYLQGAGVDSLRQMHDGVQIEPMGDRPALKKWSLQDLKTLVAKQTQAQTSQLPAAQPSSGVRGAARGLLDQESGASKSGEGAVSSEIGRQTVVIENKTSDMRRGLVVGLGILAGLGIYRLRRRLQKPRKK